MNTKKDEPGKGATGPGSAGARPHATLDLKATEVAAKPGKEAAANAPAAAKGASQAAASAQAAKPATGSTGPEEAPEPGRAPARPAGFGGIFTHLAAGILGGIFALLAADMLAGQLGLSRSADNDAMLALQQRIAALEAGDAQRGPSQLQLDARLKEAEARLAKLEPLAGRVDGLAQEQSSLASNVTGISKKLDAGGGDADVAARLAKLEEQLAAISEAASTPGGNSVPQLAALTGKLADLEQSVSQQLDALRKSVSDEIDSRFAAASEASEAARSGTRRIDRELAGLKTDTARLDSRLNAVSAQSDSATTALMHVQDEISKLKAEIGARMATLARPEDVAAAVSPVDAKVSALQQKVEGVVKGEGDRRATAERIVLSLELANLKRAIDRGGGYAAELAQARKLAGDSIDLAPLARFEATGVPTLAELRADFRTVAFKIIDAEEQPAEGSIVDRLLAGAKSVVRVRKISHGADDKTVEAIVARMETALAEDRLDEVLSEARTLPPPAQEAAQDFLAKVEARNAVDRALVAVEAQLKASLVAPAESAEPAKE